MHQDVLKEDCISNSRVQMTQPCIVSLPPAPNVTYGRWFSDQRYYIYTCYKINHLTMFQGQCARSVCQVACMAFYSHPRNVHGRSSSCRVRTQNIYNIRNVSASATQKRRAGSKKVKVPPLPTVRLGVGFSLFFFFVVVLLRGV